MYIDIHCHPNFPQYDEDREEILKKMKDENVFGICIGTDIKTSKESVLLAGENEHIYAGIGLHPTNWQEGFDEAEYQKLIALGKVVTVGECGLDYFRRDAVESEKKDQEKILRKQIEFAIFHNLPLMLHCRPSVGSQDAYEDLYKILKEYQKARGNIHFFVGSLDMAKKFLELGFHMSFTAVITFTGDYDEVIKFLPEDRIMSETDSPFVAPSILRGKRNEPINVKVVVSKIAEIKNIPEEEVKKAIINNAKRVFGVLQE